MSIRSAIFVLLLAGLSIAGARGTVPIVNHESIVIATGSGRALTADEVKVAITQAAGKTKYPWTVTNDEPETLVATTLVRGKHTAVVGISYGGTSYSITYRDSSNLSYRLDKGVPEIHPNYNVWVQQLIDAIRTQLMKL